MKELDENSVTLILADFKSGEHPDIRALLPSVYSELRRLAAAQFAQERADHTLEPTALVHETYLRLGSVSHLNITSRGHFFRLASKIMRQILVDHARARDTAKRGGGAVGRIPSGVSIAAPDSTEVDLVALEDALSRLTTLSPDKARLVELRFFGGLSIEDAADAIGISRTQASREWRTARAWLADELGAGGGQ